jgi:hypothetical protein
MVRAARKQENNGQMTRYMNDYDIDRAARQYADHPVLSDAVQTLADLKHWTDHNSDGWAYWPKPARAAAQLMELIAGNGTYADEQRIMATTTQDMLDRALRPIKAFRTKVTKLTPDAPLYGARGPMPYFPITRAERAALKVQAELAADTARADSVRRLADKLAPVIDDFAFKIRNGVGTDVPGSRTQDVARKLAELAVAGW